MKKWVGPKLAVSTTGGSVCFFINPNTLAWYRQGAARAPASFSYNNNKMLRSTIRLLSFASVSGLTFWTSRT